MTTDQQHYFPEPLAAPGPAMDGMGKEFWEATQRHELLVQRCNSCARFRWGPEWICHRCRSLDLGYERVSGRGRIYSWERIWHPTNAKLEAAVPYIIVLVELPDADDVRMIGNLIGDPEQEVPIGAEVEAVFEDHDEGEEPYTLVQWRLV